jgi:hypothetical protein
MHRLRNASLSLLAVALTVTVVADAASGRGGHSRGRMGSAALRTGPAQNQQLQAPTLTVPTVSQPSAAGAVPATGVSTAPQEHLSPPALSTAPTLTTPTALQPSPAGVVPATRATDPPGRRSPAASSALNLESQLPAPPSQPPPAPTPAIAAPVDQVPAVAPLSVPATTTILTAGGAARVNSSSSTSTSPSEATPSIAGGGGGSLADCMGFWEPATHMTKTEWKAACVRSMHRLDDVSRELDALSKDKR